MDLTEAYKNVGARMAFNFGPRNGECYDIDDVLREVPSPLTDDDLVCLEQLDLIYRTLCGMLYNFVPLSGHPGGSISSGRIVEGIIYGVLDYDFSYPDADNNDLLVYGAGHKALGLYAMWALRNELVRQIDPGLLAPENRQLRFEDLLGFRRNPINDTPLFKKFKAKALDGHPTPATPFVKIATGASGVGTASAIGLALAAKDTYGTASPKVHIIEGEGGLTPGRIFEAMAAAAGAQLNNIVLHIDWNQSSIDSDRVCRDGKRPGDYVQWNPLELARLHDFNVIFVRNGLSFPHIWAAQTLAKSLDSTQPTAIVYRTIKGWQYGIEGRKSHGAGHKFSSPEYRKHLASSFENEFKTKLSHYRKKKTEQVAIEQNYWENLALIRKAITKNKFIPLWATDRIQQAIVRLRTANRKPRRDSLSLRNLWSPKVLTPQKTPENLLLTPGTQATLRSALGQALRHLNKKTGGAFLVTAADLFDSTSVSLAGLDFPSGFYNAQTNPDSRMVAVGGICEDAMGAVMTGVSAFGQHIGVTSSYSAFIAAMQHTAARLHGIGEQAANCATGKPYHPMIIINGHAGVKTGEDGPTHADPQALQLLLENFPQGVAVTLTPWDPQEIWPLLAAALKARPAIVAPFVTRPSETVPDRQALGIAPATESINGLYPLISADPDAKTQHGTLVLQGSEVGMEFAFKVLPWIRKKKLNLNVFYVSSAELFSLLPQKKQDKIFPETLAQEAMGITGFTLPTLYRWIHSSDGRKRSIYPFRAGHYLGSGKAECVLAESGLDADSLIIAIDSYTKDMAKR